MLTKKLILILAASMRSREGWQFCWSSGRRRVRGISWHHRLCPRGQRRACSTWTKVAISLTSASWPSDTATVVSPMPPGRSSVTHRPCRIQLQTSDSVTSRPICIGGCDTALRASEQGEQFRRTERRRRSLKHGKPMIGVPVTKVAIVFWGASRPVHDQTGDETFESGHCWMRSECLKDAQ